ncbi:MAG: HAD family hydrolase [Ruminiclostridium sp.]|nr:HAD family hydrolase [Ruminiclostridium sp.]
MAIRETDETKTLYISDLDGTLLNRNAELSEYTVNALNTMIAKGIYFSIATARTAATSVLMLESVAINIPLILMNGVLIYDITRKRYLKKELLEREKTHQIFSAMRKTELRGLMYALADDNLITYYERLDSEALKNFVDERVQKYNKQFFQIDNFANVETEIIYFCFLDTNDNIHRLYKETKDIDGLRIEMYQDIYSDDLWYMEIFNETASKYNAVQFLRQNYGFAKVIGFGDNMNDIPLFEACDKCYAVANANPKVKEKATAVIGANDEDGVAKWLEENVLRKCCCTRTQMRGHK